MKRIGIIGGMSYESTLHYYEQINRKVNERAGGLVSADLVLRSVNFGEYHQLMETGNWDTITYKLATEINHLHHKNQCAYVAIATNTMHKIINDQVAFMFPNLIHIGDCIAEKCREISAKRVLLLGTKFTMTEDFMRKRLESHGLSVMDTSSYPEEINEINRIIFDELCHGLVVPESKEFMLNFVYQFPCDRDERPDAVVLGCTELNMILKPEDIDIPLIDSTEAHIDKLVNLCLE